MQKQSDVAASVSSDRAAQPMDGELMALRSSTINPASANHLPGRAGRIADLRAERRAEQG